MAQSVRLTVPLQFLCAERTRAHNLVDRPLVEIEGAKSGRRVGIAGGDTFGVGFVRGANKLNAEFSIRRGARKQIVPASCCRFIQAKCSSRLTVHFWRGLSGRRIAKYHVDSTFGLAPSGGTETRGNPRPGINPGPFTVNKLFACQQPRNRYSGRWSSPRFKKRHYEGCRQQKYGHRDQSGG